MTMTHRRWKVIEIMLGPDCPPTNKAIGLRAGYTPKSVESNMSRLIRDPEFQDKLNEEKARRLEADAELVQVPEPAAPVQTLTVGGSGQHTDKTTTAAQPSRETEPLRLKKLELEVAISESKLRRLQPDDDAGELRRVREAWIETVERAYTLGARAGSAHGEAAAINRMRGMADELESWAADRAVKAGDTTKGRPFNAPASAGRSSGDAPATHTGRDGTV